MEQCLQEISKQNQDILEPVLDNDFTDRARKQGPIADGECRYYVDDEREALTSRQADLQRQSAQAAHDTKAYVSAKCNAICKKSVAFSDDDKTTKCRHYVPTGHCLTCCP